MYVRDGALGENVNVTKFCGVEEYETVWQLVSVIEGTPGGGTSQQEEFDLGWNVLKSSFPPGMFVPVVEPLGRMLMVITFRQHDWRSQKTKCRDLAESRRR